MKLTITDDRVCIDIERGDAISLVGDGVRPSAIEFENMDFRRLLAEYMSLELYRLRGKKGGLLPPRRCGNCRFLVENRDADEMFCRTGDQVKPTNRYNTCNKHAYWKGWIND